MKNHVKVVAFFAVAALPYVSFAIDPNTRIGVQNTSGDWVYEAGDNLEYSSSEGAYTADTLPLEIKGIYARECTTSYYGPRNCAVHPYSYYTGSGWADPSPPPQGYGYAGDYYYVDDSKCRHMRQHFPDTRDIAPGTEMAKLVYCQYRYYNFRTFILDD